MSATVSTPSNLEIDADDTPSVLMEIPGFGKSHVDCGKHVPKQYCDREGHINFGPHRCGRRECPECWSSQWAGPRTASAVARLGAFRQQSGNHPRTIHAVVSFEEVETIDEFYRKRTEVNDIVKNHGIVGGITIPHPFRVYDYIKDEYKALLKVGEVDDSLWWWIRENGRSWRSQVYWSPHFHIVGTVRQSGHIDPGTDAEGWIFKNIRSLSAFHPSKPEGYEDMAGVIRYLLSHAGFESDGNRQAVTWFGALHGSNFDPENELSPGRWSQIQRLASEVVGAGVDLDRDEGEEHLETQEEREARMDCPVDGCDGKLYEIEEEGGMGGLDSNTRFRIDMARRWRRGEAKPPPGYYSPRSQDEAEEALDAIVRNYAGWLPNVRREDFL